MTSDIKKQKKVLSSIKREIKTINFKINHKSIELIKNEIKRRGKITFIKGRLFAPYILALTISIGSFSIFGANPFILDEKKNYQNSRKEIDSYGKTNIITQYHAFDSTENILSLYGKWQKKDDNTFSRTIKVYKMNNISEERIIEILQDDIKTIEDIFGEPISIKNETRNEIEKKELEKKEYLKATIYSENKDEFICVTQSVYSNISETIGWIFFLIALETIAFVYRGMSSFNYKNNKRKINSRYSKDALQMLEKKLKLLEQIYKVLNTKNSIEIEEEKKLTYLDKNNSIQFSKLNSFELKEVLYLATTIDLKLKDKLTYDEIYTYGTEIELENVKIKLVKDNLSKYKSSNWLLKKDYSLYNGIEIVSPILYDNKDCWNTLNNVCNSTQKVAFVNKNCGSHVHVGAHILGVDRNNWLNFIKLWSVYENIIFRFAYGEFLNYRDSIIEYAQPISIGLWKDYQYLKEKNANLKEILDTIQYGKYYAVNFKHVKPEYCNQIKEGNTVEIRCGNGTKNAIIWQNYINCLLALFRYAKSDNFNDEILDKRHEQCEDIYDNIEMYNEIYLDQALELCDLIFNNNQDKMYFLNQYLKNFKIDRNKFDKNKTFTKKLKK